MEIIRIPRIVQDTCKKYRMKGRSVGFVPTMGALHEGHLSLIRRSRMENDITVVSIFVNPLQFGPSEDLARYPRDVESDSNKISALETDILFLPDDALMYSPAFSTSVEVAGVSEKLCGRFRPGHFRGVATVVAKLFNIVSPTRAYFGQKDYQQTVVIRRMVKDLNFDLEVVICPTIREHDGLAISSRNTYLGPEERIAAAAIHRSLSRGAGAVLQGERSAGRIREMVEEGLAAEKLINRIDYVAAVDLATLDDVEEIGREIVLAAAVRIGKTRLIDNLLVNV
ncbi:MAG: pantoate--beta-alanine ligase [Nitrospiraceae bacterium]|nr:pantoate--beta-alanine ligase [Nitrospiraceae bacterium]